MFCKHCGKELEENQSVCPACGMDNQEELIVESAEETVEETAVLQDIPAEENHPEENRKVSTKKKVIVGTAIGLVVALIVSLVLCVGFDVFTPKENDIYYKDSYTVSAKQAAKKHDAIVAALGEYELNNGQLQVYYWMQVYDFLSDYSYFLSYIGLDYTQDLSTQTCTMVETEMSWEEFFLEEALFTWQRYQALYASAVEAGYQMPEEYQKDLSELKESMEADAVKNGYESADAMLQEEFGPGVVFDDYMYYLERYYVGNLYFSELVDKLEVTDEEIEAYFKENAETLEKNGITKESGLMLTLRQILIAPESSKDANGNTVYTDAAWEECRKQTQEIFDQWLAGEKTEDSFSALATEKSKDSTTASSGGLLQNVSKLDMTTVDVRHILIMPVDPSEFSTSETYTDEQWEACRKEAQDLLDQFLAGEQTEDAFGNLANTYSDDNNGKVTNGGIYTDVAKGKMVTEFDEWIFDASRTEGETGLVKTVYGYHVMYFIRRDDAIDQWAFADDRKEGDTTLVKTDDGYRVLYYVSGEEGWIVYSRSGVLSNKSSDLLESFVEDNAIGVTYKNIAMGAPDLSQ